MYAAARSALIEFQAICDGDDSDFFDAAREELGGRLHRLPDCERHGSLHCLADEVEDQGPYLGVVPQCRHDLALGVALTGRLMKHRVRTDQPEEQGEIASQ